MKGQAGVEVALDAAGGVILVSVGAREVYEESVVGCVWESTGAKGKAHFCEK